MSKIGFVIMQIGNKELDDLYSTYIRPTLLKAGFEPKRVDKHNDGQLIKPKITEFISDASIIVADLTNERPNCYLEVGYAMGLGKYQNLILTAREDHYSGSPNYKSNGKKIHFDLNGYDILFWSPEKKDEFASKLLQIIKRRTYITQPSKAITVDNDWLDSNKAKAMAGLKKQNISGYMEMSSTLRGEFGFNQIELRDAAREAPIDTFGWPIGVFLDNNEFRPKPLNDGIVAEIITPEKEWGLTYDYWTLRSNGSFYLLHSLFENTRDKAVIYFDVRINRVTESLLYLARLYRLLRIDGSTPVHISIEHSGIKGRSLKAAGNRTMFGDKEASVDSVVSEINTTVEELDSKLIDHVEKLARELFVVFNYFSIDRKIVEEIVTNFINGKIT